MKFGEDHGRQLAIACSFGRESGLVHSLLGRLEARGGLQQMNSGTQGFEKCCVCVLGSEYLWVPYYKTIFDLPVSLGRQLYVSVYALFS